MTDSLILKVIFMYLFPAVTEDLYHNYTHGVYYDVTNNTDIDHDISVVGYGYDEETGWDYWLVRNSWGTYWVSTKKSLFSVLHFTVSLKTNQKVAKIRIP